MQLSSEQLLRRRWLSSTSIAVAAGILLVAQSLDMLSGLRTGLHDVLSPGRMIVLALRSAGGWNEAQRHSKRLSDEGPVAELESALRESERQRRALLIRNARLRNALRTAAASERASAVAGLHAPTLLQFDALACRVISRAGMPDRVRELVIDAGKQVSATRAELVVDGTGLLIDRGASSGVSEGARVLDGAVVIGRIARAARWVSLVEPVTAPTFSARVQLVRGGSDTPHFGAEGILQGAGDGTCVVNGIPDTEPVAVGDEVVSADIDGVRGPRLYFGVVTAAEFLSGGEWRVQVAPAADPESAEEVAVLQLNLKTPPAAASNPDSGLEGASP